MSNKSIQLPVVFTDITWDKNIAERFGKINTRNLLLKAMNIITSAVKEHSGKIVKARDNQLFCTFPNTKKAIQAACMQQRNIYAEQLLVNIKTSLKIGMHYGDVVLSKDDVSGDAVEIARKMNEIAKDGQILLSREAADEIPRILNIPVGLKGKLKVKGKILKIDVLEAIWQTAKEEHTVFIDDEVKMKSSDSVLVLKFEGKKYQLNKSRTSFLFGRSNENDIIIDNASISRNHASIRYVGGKFKLIDQSTNGTFLQTEDKQDHFLHGEEMMLSGKGVFCLGHKVEKNHPCLVYFSVIDK